MQTNRISKTAALAVCLVLLLPAAMALDPPPSPTQDLVDPCATVPGTVTEENGSPIEAITVLALSGPDASLLLAYDGDETGPDGKYSLELTQGTWFIVAASASDDTDNQFLVANKTIEIDTCGVQQPLDFQLAPLAAAGNDERGFLNLTLVEDVDGIDADDNVSAPMVGYPVTIWNACEPSTSGQEALKVATGTTNAEGKLRLTLPATSQRDACLEIGIGPDFIDTGAGGNRDGVFFDPEAVAITAGETTELQYNFTKKLRFVTIAVEDNDVPDRLIGGVAVKVRHPIYCPGGDKPTGVNDRYDCSATTATQSTEDGPAGTIEILLPIDGHAGFGRAFQFDGTHPQFFPKTDSCLVQNAPVGNNPGNTPATQQALECRVDMGHVSKLLSGRVVDAGGNPQAGRSVTIDGALDLDDKTLTTGPDGRFAIAARSDDYVIGVDGAHFCATVTSAAVTLGDLRLGGSEQTVTGNVIDPIDSSPVTNFPVRLRDQDTGHACHSRTAADGSFAITVPDQTNYTVIVGDDVDLSISFKADEDSEVRFVDATGAPADPDTSLGTFALERRDGKLEVTVFADQNPDVAVEGVQVTCENTFTGYVATSHTNDAGKINFRMPFGPGYECTARDPTGQLFLAKSDTREAPTLVEDDYDTSTPDDNKKLDLLMQRTAFEISGTITDVVSEAPLAGVVVTAANLRCALLGGSTCSLSTITDDDGNYLVRVPYSPIVEVYDGGTADPDNDLNGNGNLVQGGTRVNPISLSFTRAGYFPLLVPGLAGPDAVAQMQAAADQALVPTLVGGGGPGVPDVPGVPEDTVPDDAVPNQDMDEDGVLDALEPVYCAALVGAVGGSCDGDDYDPMGDPGET